MVVQTRARAAAAAAAEKEKRRKHRQSPLVRQGTTVITRPSATGLGTIKRWIREGDEAGNSSINAPSTAKLNPFTAKRYITPQNSLASIPPSERDPPPAPRKSLPHPRELRRHGPNECIGPYDADNRISAFPFDSPPTIFPTRGVVAELNGGQRLGAITEAHNEEEALKDIPWKPLANPVLSLSQTTTSFGRTDTELIDGTPLGSPFVEGAASNPYSPLTPTGPPKLGPNGTHLILEPERAPRRTPLRRT